MSPICSHISPKFGEKIDKIFHKIPGLMTYAYPNVVIFDQCKFTSIKTKFKKYEVISNVCAQKKSVRIFNKNLISGKWPATILNCI